MSLSDVLLIIGGILLLYVSINYVIAPLFFPSEMIDSTYDIDFEKLYEEGYRGVIFDIDNTLVKHNERATKEAVELLSKLNEIGFSVLFLSNNKEPRVKLFRDESLANAMYIFKAGKPLKKGYLEAVNKMGITVDTAIFVGDQLFTDVWGAKRCGIYHILVKPIDKKEEIQIVLKRKLEWIVLHNYKKYGKSPEKKHEIAKNS